MANDFTRTVENTRFRKKMKWWMAVLLTLLGIIIAILMVAGFSVYQYLFVKSEGGKKSGRELVPMNQPPLPTAVRYAPGLPSETLGDLYVNSQEGFSIRPPREWETDVNETGEAVFFFGPENQGFRPNISVQTGLAYGHLLEGYKQFYVADIKRKQQSFEVLEERQLTLYGRNAVLIIFSFLQDGLKLRGEVLLMVNADKAYVATGVDLETSWGETQWAIESSLYSFNLL